MIMLKFTAVLVSTLLSTAFAANSTQVVDLGYAKYQATLDASANVTNFLGIRFAAPPVGKLRFQAPQPPLVQSGIQLANVQPAGCPQTGTGNLSTNPFRGLKKRQNSNVSEIEDCLMLNVHVPGTIKPGAKMPVILFIHGGGYEAGTTASDSGADLIREAGGGIVAVESEYRLGIFGFLAGEEIKKHGALNAGLLDQNAVLKWIQKFIHLFGGDPGQVTIWGESAGAGSVLQHLVAHKGNTQPPLFHRAMTSSTFLPNQYNFNDAVPEFLYSETVKLAGCANASSTFDCLVAVPPAQLQDINVQVCTNGFSGTFLLVPVVDGEFIVERPIATISTGKLNAKTILMVTNTDEGSPFVNANVTAQLSLEQYVTALMPQFNTTQVNSITNLYKDLGSTVFEQASLVMGESIFVCPSYNLLNPFQGTAHKGMFAIPPATHGSDVQFYFPGNTTPTFANPQFDASFAGAFTAVIKSGDPNIHPVPDVITPNWPVFKAGHPGVEMRFNRTEDGQPNITTFTTDAQLISRCEVWKNLAPFIPQ